MVKARGPHSQQIYKRQLPGRGFVTIEVSTVRNVLGRRKYHGEVVVERRSPERREGHDAPVIARADAVTMGTVFHELFPTAHSNVAIAARCLARQRERALPR
ncbi:MAG: hypothetical protein WD825_13975 [Gemmatimonadaceae bacterium]